MLSSEAQPAVSPFFQYRFVPTPSANWATRGEPCGAG